MNTQKARIFRPLVNSGHCNSAEILCEPEDKFLIYADLESVASEFHIKLSGLWQIADPVCIYVFWQLSESSQLLKSVFNISVLHILPYSNFFRRC